MALRDKPNEELFRLYDSELVLHLNNPKNVRTARKLLDDFSTFLGGAPPSEESAKEYLSGFRHLKATTRAWYAQTVKGFMKWYGMPLEDVRIKVPRPLPPYVEDEAVEKLISAAADKRSHKDVVERDQILIETLWRTGLRRTEVAKLCPHDISDGKIFVRGGKGEKDRVVPLIPSLDKKLAAFVNGMTPNQSIFNLSAGAISNKILTIARRAGIEGMHTHALRHKFATDLLERGTNVRVVQQLLGHENLNTTQVYLSLTDEQLVEAVNRLEVKQSALSSESSTLERKIEEVSVKISITPDPFQKEFPPDWLLIGKMFELPISSDRIVIDSLMIQTSDPRVPYKPCLFAGELPREVEDVDVEDLLGIEEPVRKRVYTWQPPRPFSYRNLLGQKMCQGSISIGQRPLRFDLDRGENPEGWSTYYESPVTFEIMLRYLAE